MMKGFAFPGPLHLQSFDTPPMFFLNFIWRILYFWPGDGTREAVQYIWIQYIDTVVEDNLEKGQGEVTDSYGLLVNFFLLLWWTILAHKRLLSNFALFCAFWKRRLRGGCCSWPGPADAPSNFLGFWKEPAWSFFLIFIFFEPVTLLRGSLFHYCHEIWTNLSWGTRRLRKKK